MKKQEEIDKLIKKLTDDHVEQTSKLGKTIEDQEEKLLELVGDSAKEQKAKDQLQKNIDKLKKDLEDKNNEIKTLPDKIRKRLEEEVKADKQEEYEKELSDRQKEFEEEREQFIEAKKQLMADAEALEIERSRYQTDLSIDVWINALNKMLASLAQELGFGNRQGFWKLFDKEHFQLMASNFMNVQKEFRLMEEVLKDRKLIK